MSALFALATGDRYIGFVLLAYFPAIAFWVLDSYFLWQEKLFRELYDSVCKITDDSKVDFSMNTQPFIGKVNSRWTIMKSETILGFHGVIIVSIVIVMIIFLIVKGCGG